MAVPTQWCPTVNSSTVTPFGWSEVVGRLDKAGVDLFPTGKYPVFPDPYGDDRCFIVPLAEKAGNPNY